MIRVSLRMPDGQNQSVDLPAVPQRGDLVYFGHDKYRVSRVIHRVGFPTNDNPIRPKAVEVELETE